MPRHKSAEKRVRQETKRRLRNRANRSNLRTEIRRLREAIASGDAAKARELYSPTAALIDRSIQKGVLHANTAARYKSRLALSVNRLAG